jgi:hypothetical protein
MNATRSSLTNVDTLRKRARQHIEEGAVTQGYDADRTAVLEMLNDLGLWSSFEAWKRVIVEAVERTPYVTPNYIRIFDFAGYDEFTTEAVPPPGDRRSEMRWYWEPGHYKSLLGERILAVIFQEDPHFGHLLTPANIESVLMNVRQQRTRFLAQRGPVSNVSHKFLAK